MSVVLDGGSVCLKMHFIVRHELYEARRICVCSCPKPLSQMGLNIVLHG